MGLKENIKSKRLELGLTLEEVANKIGVKKPTLQRYESGVISNIPSDKIEALAEVFDISPGYLMGWENKKEIKQTEDTISIEERKLLKNFNKLNKTGKDEAIKRVEELTCINKYIDANNTKVDEDSSYLNPVAAHDDNLTNEEKNRMDEIIFKKLKELGKL